MKISVVSGEIVQHATPMLVLGTWDGESLPTMVSNLLEVSDWYGRFKQMALLYPRGAIAAKRVLLLGLGKRAQFTTDRLHELAAVAAQQARSHQLESFTFVLPVTDGVAISATAQAIAEGSILGLYRFQEFKSELKPEDQHAIAEMFILASSAAEEAIKGAELGEIIARGTLLARDLANRPGNALVPATLAEIAQELGVNKGLNVTVLGPAELTAQGFGGILGVGQGSANPPRFIVMEYGENKKSDLPTICLVGKGITFDTGGISIKPAENMELMKMDMGGAAAVLGTMQVVAEMKPAVHVIGLIASAENMPGPNAYKPGDILKTLSGKTVEVINTDAEGRIVLADALFYAQRYKPAAIIDLATLTGAITVALGPHAIGLMSNNDELAQRVLDASNTSGERAWRLPLWDPYREMVKSDVADIKNSTGRLGGSITAAAFLENFVGDYPWVHLDIAGTAWTDARPRAYTPKGATGIGVRLLAELIMSWLN